MDSTRAREILRLYRPGTTDALDPQMAEALQLVQQDPELAKWFEEHCGVYIAIRNKLKQIEVPQDLKRKILLENVGRKKIIPLRRRPELLWAAAAVIALVAAGVWFFNPTKPQVRFAQFRDWKLGDVIRGYSMISNTNYTQIVSNLVASHFIADYTLTKGLVRLPIEGYNIKPFQNKPVTMLCFNGGLNARSGKTNLIYFFVARSADLAGSPLPGKKPQFDYKDTAKGRFTSATWSAGDKVYILTTQGNDADLQPYLD